MSFGTLALQLLVLALAWLALMRLRSSAWKSRGTFAIKLYLTALVFQLILFHEVDGRSIYATLAELLPRLDAKRLVLFSLIATLVRLTGISASITRWTLLLRGQRIELPVRHIVGAFFIGRFFGTFLPSTLGLDGYKLYDAARFSGRTIETTAATAVEKVLGISGIFGTFLIALPLGASIFGEYVPLIAGVGIPLALLPLVVIALAFFWPGPILVHRALRHLPLPTLQRTLERLADGISAYSGRKRLLLAAWCLSLVSHFMTAATYYFTALALGVSPLDATFWEVAFASSIQIFATVISPFTIAGEGIRELAQGLLLQGQMTFAVAAASGMLGFLVAELPTLLGVIPWFARREGYVPAWGRVDGQPIDWAEARRAATDLGTSRVEATAGTAAVDRLPRRLSQAGSAGVAAGVFAGVGIGFAEAIYLLLLGKVALEAQVFWTAPLVYGGVLAAAGLAGGLCLGALPFPRELLRRWVPALGLAACTAPYALVASVFFLYRDFHAERIPPAAEIATLLAAHLLLAGLLLGLPLLLDRSRFRALLRAPAALLLAALLVGAGAAFGTALGPRESAPPLARPTPEQLDDAPNVLFIIVDTLRADALPAYGGNAVETPALDRLAGEATAFRAFAQASWTKPSIASILTSLYPSSHGATHKPSRLPDSVDTLAEVVSAFGYATGAIVTNIHLAPSFNFQQGFDEYHYLVPDYLFGVADSTSRLLVYEIARRIAGRVSGGVRPGQAYQPAEVVNERALAWLDRHRGERFFLLLHYMEPHDPYFAHPDDGRAIARATTPDPDPAQRDEMLRRYRAEIEYLDARLAELFDAFEARGLWDELLVVLTSDHGEEFLDHGGFWHGLTLYDEQIAVPLIVRWPGGARAAPARWEAQVRSIDVAPTLLAYLGAPIPPAMQGDDLLADTLRERPVFAEEDHEGNALAALRVRDWKLIRANPQNPRGLAELELYRLSEDPGERHDRATQDAADLRRLLADLDGLQRLARAQAHAEQLAEIDRRECERLQALGYVGECR